MTFEQMEQEAGDLMLKGFHCGQAVLCVGLKKLGIEDKNLVKSQASMGGGIASTGGPCGAFTGGVVCIGRVFGRITPEDPDDRRMWKASYEFYKRFQQEIGKEAGGSVHCGDLARVDWKNREQVAAHYGGPGRARCAGFTGKAAAILGEVLEKYVTEEDIKKGI